MAERRLLAGVLAGVGQSYPATRGGVDCRVRRAASRRSEEVPRSSARGHAGRPREKKKQLLDE
jgi:hypothetical protein